MTPICSTQPTSPWIGLAIWLKKQCRDSPNLKTSLLRGPKSLILILHSRYQALPSRWNNLSRQPESETVLTPQLSLTVMTPRISWAPAGSRASKNLREVTSSMGAPVSIRWLSIFKTKRSWKAGLPKIVQSEPQRATQGAKAKLTPRGP